MTKKDSLKIILEKANYIVIAVWKSSKTIKCSLSNRPN